MYSRFIIHVDGTIHNDIRTSVSFRKYVAYHNSFMDAQNVYVC